MCSGWAGKKGEKLKRRYRRLMRYGATDPPVHSHKHHQWIIFWVTGKKGAHAFLSHRAGDSRALHFTLGVDDDTGVVLEVVSHVDQDQLLGSDIRNGMHTSK